MSIITFLDEMIEASHNAVIGLDMKSWHCGSSCCLIGDLAIARGHTEKLDMECIRLSNRLGALFAVGFGHRGFSIAESIYVGKARSRLGAAERSKFFSEQELKHPHLNEDHSSREIAIDFMKLVIHKVRLQISCKIA